MLFVALHTRLGISDERLDGAHTFDFYTGDFPVRVRTCPRSSVLLLLIYF